MPDHYKLLLFFLVSTIAVVSCYPRLEDLVAGKKKILQREMDLAEFRIIMHDLISLAMLYIQEHGITLDEAWARVTNENLDRIARRDYIVRTYPDYFEEEDYPIE